MHFYCTSRPIRGTPPGVEHGPFVASLCSHQEELTPRTPVSFDKEGAPVWRFVGRGTCNGVGDRVLIWCAGCGGYVREHRLLQLFAVSCRGKSTTYALPAPSMLLRGRAEA